MTITKPITIKIDTSAFTAATNRLVENLAVASRSIRVFALRAKGWHDLADVVEKQEGRQIVREGMADVLEWIGEK